MVCPKCQHEQPDGLLECRRCGIIFEKFYALQVAAGTAVTAREVSSEDEDSEGEEGFFGELFLYVQPQTNVFYFAGRVFAFLLILVWGARLIFTPMETNFVGESFMHLVNLPFHEAGHFFFRPFGQFVMMLGGTLGQILMPLICFVTLLLHTRDTFGASVCLWWVGESFMDIAPYINDARDLKLILLGGVTGRETVDYHDWEFILRKLGWLPYDHTLAKWAYGFGIFLMLVTFVWGGYLLFKQFRNIETK